MIDRPKMKRLFVAILNWLDWKTDGRIGPL
jgi:hypothetical protein